MSSSSSSSSNSASAGSVPSKPVAKNITTLLKQKGEQQARLLAEQSALKQQEQLAKRVAETGFKMSPEEAKQMLELFSNTVSEEIETNNEQQDVESPIEKRRRTLRAQREERGRQKKTMEKKVQLWESLVRNFVTGGEQEALAFLRQLDETDVEAVIGPRRIIDKEEIAQELGEGFGEVSDYFSLEGQTSVKKAKVRTDAK